MAYLSSSVQAPNHQIREGNCDSFCRLLTADAGDNLLGGSGDWMDRNVLFSNHPETGGGVETSPPRVCDECRDNSATAGALVTIGTSPAACLRFRITSGVVSLPRSAATRMMESTTKPLSSPSFGDFMGRCGSRCLPQNRVRSLLDGPACPPASMAAMISDIVGAMAVAGFMIRRPAGPVRGRREGPAPTRLR